MTQLVLIIGRGEGGKIVLAFKQRGHLEYARLIERVRVMIHVAVFEGRADFGAMDTVLVGLGLGLVARVEIRRGLVYFEHANVARQQTVDSLAQIVHGNGVDQREPRYLRERVDAGVSAS